MIHPFIQQSHRGNIYDYNPANFASRRPFQHTRTCDLAYELIYRGNTYQVEPTVLTLTETQNQ